MLKMEAITALNKYFGYDSFRDCQEKIIADAIDKNDQFIILPTGSGKSICFQLPALIQGGITIVISPLKSLIKDQVANLDKLNIKSDALYGDITVTKKMAILNSMISEDYDRHLIYTTPETISGNSQFIDNLKVLEEVGRLNRFVIDESHCISLWGNDFRSCYRKLGDIKSIFPNIPIMALTATATHRVRKDTLHLLQISNAKIYTKSYFRPNLQITVKPRVKSESFKEMVDIITEKYCDKSGIIYCLSRKSCEEMAENLQQCGIDCEAYHAGQSAKKRADVQNKWQTNEIPLIIATIAFGMGINKPDVRYVIHFNLPFSIENYYQEIGRAGRDGQHSECILYYSNQDHVCAKKLILSSGTKHVSGSQIATKYKQHQLNKLDTMIAFCQNIKDCRHCQISNYLGELRSYAHEKCNESCCNCSNKDLIEHDVSDFAVCIIESIMNLREKPTKTAIETSMLSHQSYKRLVNKYAGGIDATQKIRNGLSIARRLFMHLLVHKYIKESFIRTQSGFWRENYELFSKSKNVLLKKTKVFMYM